MSYLGLAFCCALAANPYPADIGFCIADIKFDGTSVKICEFGQGTVSQFNGYDALYSKGAMFVLAWNVLHGLHSKCVVIGADNIGNLSSIYALPVLCQREKVCVPSYDKLSAHPKKKMTLTRGMSPQFIESYDGIAATFDTHILKDTLSKQKTMSKGHYIILDRATTYWVNNKSLTDELFDNEGLRLFRPGCCECDKKIGQYELQAIMELMPSDYYVIKPLNASRGRGVVMLHRQELCTTIQTLFSKGATMLKAKDQAFAYWPSDKNKTFLLEQFYASKSLVVDGHPYDPTMRVVFILSNNAGKTQVTFLDAYWKLPEKSLDQDGSMTEKHKSHIIKKSVSSCIVDRDDFKKVTMLLEPVLIRVYEKMLAQTYTCSRDVVNV